MNRLLAILLPVLAALAGCAHMSGTRAPCIDTAEDAPATPSARTLAGASWLCQLQEASPEKIAASGFDIVVMDYSRDGSEAGRYGQEAVRELKRHGKQVLAYLSIGEAEDYRYYFQRGWVSWLSRQPKASAPCWLASTNPEWRGNYKVQYWSEDWQRIVIGYLDRILDDGYDGAFLDIIDAYVYWSDPANGEALVLSREEAAARMIRFVKRLAHHARFSRGVADFLIVPQNGESLLAYDRSGEYLETLSAFSAEDLYFSEEAPVDPEESAARKADLDRARMEGKAVLVLDYVDRGIRPVTARVTEFRRRALADGYLPYAGLSDRALDAINTFPGQPPE